MTYSKKLHLEKNIRVAGASVRGISHIKAKKPNQDAVLIYKSKFGIIMAVADGVGSHQFSRYGSKTAVKAVKTAFLQFEKNEIDRKEITSTIYKQYCQGIKQKYINAAATTCLFAVLSYKHGLFVGQIGDGLSYVDINGLDWVIKPKEEDFSNIVVAMTPTKGSAKWTTKFFKISSDDKVRILLCTDGVSSGIIPGKEGECASYYINEINKKHALSYNYYIKKYLKNWNIKGENDDKTMIVFSKG